MHNLLLFGKTIKHLRLALNLTRQALSEMSGVHIDTIRNIENNRNKVPKVETLEKLSFYLKKDLNLLLLDYRLDDFSNYNNILNSLDVKLENYEFNLCEEIDKLNEIIKSNKNEYFKLLIEQLIIFIKAIIDYRNKNYTCAYKKFIESLKMTSPDFNIDNFDNIFYSKFEVRLLINIALTSNRLKNNKIYVTLLEFCLECEEIDIKTYLMCSHNLSVAYCRSKEYDKALNAVNKGINLSIEKQYSNFLNGLYYQKGLIEHKLNNKEYINSINKSIFLCNLYKKNGFLEDVIFKSSLVKNSYYKFKKEIF